MLTEMRGIVMDFGPVRAVDHVDLTVEPGEIHGLLGENGAGKSTLMNVLAGTFVPKAGDIRLNGQTVRMHNARTAMRHGIRFIHQELNLCQDLKVFENMYLAQELKTKGGLLDKQRMADNAKKVFERMRVAIDPWETVENLQTADKQLVEIARALLFECDLIIMDEPTSALSGQEIDNLFAIMRQLKQQGVSFIYISHKMPEIFEICETYTVLRDGKFVSTGNIQDVTQEQITQMMTGKALQDDTFDSRVSSAKEQVALEARDLSGDGFAHVSFALRAGEILAVTGLQSSGREQLADALFGVMPHTGEILVQGKPVKGSVRSFMRRGVAMVPRNRKERGIHNDLNILDNLSMGYFNTRMKEKIISAGKEKTRYLRQKQALRIRADNPKNVISSLSGGNQQKVILGRWLETDANVLLFDNPTQGIDVGSKFEIYNLMLALAKEGKAILCFSAEFPEILKVADRCVVMYKGSISAVLSRSQMTEESLMHHSTGSVRENQHV